MVVLLNIISTCPVNLIPARIVFIGHKFVAIAVLLARSQTGLFTIMTCLNDNLVYNSAVIIMSVLVLSVCLSVCLSVSFTVLSSQSCVPCINVCLVYSCVVTIMCVVYKCLFGLQLCRHNHVCRV